MIDRTFDMDFNALDRLKDQMQDNLYVEYIYHKLFQTPDWTWEEAKKYPPVWYFPECWRARYWLYYEKHQKFLHNAHVLDLGSNMNFYGVWALNSGAAKVTAVEPDLTRKTLGDEYVQLRGYTDQFSTHNQTIEDFVYRPAQESYDVIFFLDIMYYLTNAVNIMSLLKKQFNTRYLFLETTVVDDNSDNGHFEIWYPSTDPKKFQSFDNTSKLTSRLALKPSRQALYNIIIDQGWKIISYYNYQDFKGHGESPPRHSGHKDFYLLENIC